MKNIKIFKILYYVCFIVSLILSFCIFGLNYFVDEIYNDFIGSTGFGGILVIINILLVLIFSFGLLRKRKIKEINNLFPILFLVFTIIVVGVSFVFNSILIIPYIHFNYYISLILFNYLLLNIYSVLSLSK